MTDMTDRFVIRRHTPVRTVMLRLAGLLVALFALYVVFEFGRYSAGFDRASASAQRGDMQQVIAALNGQIQTLHAQVAQLQTLEGGASQEHQVFGQEISELQGQIDRDRQDLAMYRGVIAPSASGTSLQVQQLRITAGDAADHFALHMTLMQSGKPDATVTGEVSVRVTGESNGATAFIDGEGGPPKGAVSFRYYQAVDYQVAVPAGFQPTGVVVTLREGRANGSVGTQNFPWRVDVQP
jgi:TolA-binding protein